jgi:flagellar motor switch protein FliN/FliY
MTQAPTAEMETQDPSPVQVHDAQLPEVTDSGARVPGGQMDILLDTTIEVTANLGDARMPARDLMQLGPGAVVTLERQAGEPVDLVLNGIRFATGHLVLVGDHLGIRIKEILACTNSGSPAA